MRFFFLLFVGVLLALMALGPTPNVDMTISLLAHNLYRILASYLTGFENCTVSTINRKFLETGARLKIVGKEVTVHLKKKTHLPILFELPWMKQTNNLSWLGLNIRFEQGTENSGTSFI